MSRAVARILVQRELNVNKGDVRDHAVSVNCNRYFLVDIGYSQMKSRTPLFVAARYGFADIVEMLMNDPRVDPNCVNVRRDALLVQPLRLLLV
jgi:hypothetical protein